MNPNLDALLARTDAVMAGQLGRAQALRGPVHAGVDLGTAYSVLMVLDESKQPIGGAYRFAQVVRDGLVVDFVGAVELLRDLKQKVEARLGFELTSAASAYPPGVPLAEVRATANVLRAAGLECSGLIDEPTAANDVLQIRDGAIVDVGGGTTGLAVFKGGQVVYTADEPTGGTHFSLVIAGAKNLTFEQAEEIKKDPRQQPTLFPMVRPVMEKVGAIIRRHIAGHNVDTIYLVGGTVAYPGMDAVIEEYTGVKTSVPGSPLFVTPLGIAMHN
ncbi:MAG: ethanolamine utilization protein EutJ [Anaerolineales bacterium]